MKGSVSRGGEVVEFVSPPKFGPDPNDSVGTKVGLMPAMRAETSRLSR